MPRWIRKLAIGCGGLLILAVILGSIGYYQMTKSIPVNDKILYAHPDAQLFFRMRIAEPGSQSALIFQEFLVNLDNTQYSLDMLEDPTLEPKIREHILQQKSQLETLIPGIIEYNRFAMQDQNATTLRFSFERLSNLQSLIWSFIRSAEPEEHRKTYNNTEILPMGMDDDWVAKVDRDFLFSNTLDELKAFLDTHQVVTLPIVGSPWQHIDQESPIFGFSKNPGLLPSGDPNAPTTFPDFQYLAWSVNLQGGDTATIKSHLAITPSAKLETYLNQFLQHSQNAWETQIEALPTGYQITVTTLEFHKLVDQIADHFLKDL
jgi:hypothetical protein